MKFSTLILFVMLLLLGSQLSATTWRVNNMPNTDPDFTTIQDAHDAASNGDTILVEGSPVEYSAFTCTKRLVIIGPGFFLDENPNAPSSNPATIFGTSEFDRTDNDDPASGSAGSQLIGISTANIISINTNDVVVKGCLLDRVTIRSASPLPATGVQIIQNYFAGNDIDPFPSNSELVNVQIINNIFVEDFELTENCSGSIRNNLFLSPEIAIPSFVGDIRNNIITTTSADDVAISVTGSPSQISHNVAANGQFGSANNNITADPGELFVGPFENSTDGQYQLQSDSPASANGSDGTDRGPFGGTDPYRLSGLGNIPGIIGLDIEPVGSDNDMLNVRIIAVSSN